MNTQFNGNDFKWMPKSITLQTAAHAKAKMATSEPSDETLVALYRHIYEYVNTTSVRHPAIAPDDRRSVDRRNEFKHYQKDVKHLDFIDVYRTLDLFKVEDHAIGHATKKLLCAGQRGSKSAEKDVAEAIATLQRWQQMQLEDGKSQVET